jgi:osmotically inducible protein OsmC
VVVSRAQEAIMSISTATGEWKGTFKGGAGTMKPAHGGDVAFSAGTRFEGAKGSNPEEMIGAALAGCFSMALSVGLEKAGITPESIRTEARVHLEKEDGGFGIPRIDLTTAVRAQGDAEKIRAVAEDTKKACPVSKVLRATIHLEVQIGS